MAGGAFAPYERFAAGKTSAQAEFISAEHFKPKGGSRLWRLKPQKEGAAKIDISSFGPVTINATKPAFRPVALLRRTSVFASGENLGAGRIHFARAFKYRRVKQAFGLRNPKRKTRLTSCLSFWCARRESNPHALASTGT